MADENVTQQDTNKKVTWAIAAGTAVLIGAATLVLRYCTPEPVPTPDGGPADSEADADADVDSDSDADGDSDVPPAPVCGNASVESGEVCDDGNSVNTDACLDSCVAASCGDSHVQSGVEECDDGNSFNTDACLATCKLAVCGDLVVRQQVEQCDDGNSSNTDSCLSCRNATCGDGSVWDAHEQCDDGNTSNSDSCVVGCLTSRCGDSYVRQGVEACDDGNSVNTDACLNTCVASRCGDGIVRSGTEACDDGNTAAGDGCSSTCTVEPPPVPPTTGAPVTLYQDLVSAPAGAFVTVWGRSFGATQGTSTVELAGQPVTVLSWSDTMVELKLPNNATSGDLRVRTSLGLSGPLSVRVHTGRLLFVSTTGVDTNPGTELQPVRTFGQATRMARAGDVFYIRGGAYTSEHNFDAVWSLYDFPTGTQAQPIAIVAYPGEVPLLGNGSLRIFSFYREPNTRLLEYLTFAKLHMRMACLGISAIASSHGRMVGNVALGATRECQDGVFTVAGGYSAGGTASDWKILGNTISNNGRYKQDHAIYIQGYGTNQDIEIAWNKITNEVGGRAIQIYGHTTGDRVERVQIHDNEIVDDYRDGILVGGSDGGSMIVSDIRIYNNLITRAGRCVDSGIRVSNPSATGVVIEHNTLVDNGSNLLTCDDSWRENFGQIAVLSATQVVVRNNILVKTSAGGTSTFLQFGSNMAARTTVERNLYFGGSAPTQDTRPLTGDPRFVNQTGLDYRLQVGSPAIDAALNSTVPLDHVSLPRVGLPDLGAFEYRQ